jgi:hypothetical protein
MIERDGASANGSDGQAMADAGQRELAGWFNPLAVSFPAARYQPQ